MLHTIDPAALSLNPFTLIGKDWALLTAGGETGFNPMTVSWGNMGVMWNKNIVTVYVRPQRYTKEFIDRSDKFTLSFFEESMRPALKLCGSKSGRDLNKVEATGLTPIFEDGTTCFGMQKDLSGQDPPRRLPRPLYQGLLPSGRLPHHLYG